MAVHRLFSVTDDGLVGVDDLGSPGAPPSESARFPNTKRFVLHDVPLLPNGAGSVLQIDQRAVWELKF